MLCVYVCVVLVGEVGVWLGFCGWRCVTVVVGFMGGCIRKVV